MGSRAKYSNGTTNGYCNWELTKSWLTMSNDDFYNIYGFNWVPPIWMQEEIKKPHSAGTEHGTSA